MVGYDGESILTDTDFMIAGAASGCITRLMCQPLDVLKIRFQLQIEPIRKISSSNSKYHSIFQATQLIVKEEGFHSLWKGHIPGQLLSISYGLVQFTTFEILTKRLFFLQKDHHWYSVVNFTCGMISGCTATLVSFPFDVVRTRLVAQNDGRKIYGGVTHGFHMIIKQEGPQVLFRGLLPTFLQVGPFAGAQFMFYKMFDNLFKDTVFVQNSTLTSSLLAGSLSGLVAKFIVFPMDVIKKRLQIQGFNRGPTFGKNFVCDGMLNCIHLMYKSEGYRGFFKGLNAGLLKAAATSALYFSSYEMTCDVIKKYRNM